jgi:uncharacterized coiled-coil DUF342 family protein
MSYNTFENDIKMWVQYDNEINELNSKIKQIKTKKADLNDKIEDYVNEQNLNSAVVKISDGKLQFKEVSNLQSLTLGYIRDCLKDLITSEDQINSIMNHIKNKREKKFKFEINRYTDKK